jgi:O-acetyl-ADP-ribose deacetylase (regulator of RNase III)
MQRRVRGVYIDVITEEEAIRGILVSPGEHVAFKLAGEICEDIRAELAPYHENENGWEDDVLNWDDPARRYTSCLESYGTPEVRVNYFRKLLKGKVPSFAHHAIALLMSSDILHRSALTTNFDKLIEQAFMEQNARECQAIRMREEAEFWGQEPDRCYLLKLHGDYDTHNILNTREETRSIPPFFVELCRGMLHSRGLLSLGSAGNEESIVHFMELMLNSPEKRILSRGVRWGVYVGSRKPDDISDHESADILVKALKAGAVNRRLLEAFKELSKEGRPCYLFPVWGSGEFLHHLIERTGDVTVEYSANILLDQSMRIASLLQAKGIPPPVIDQHLKRLDEAQNRLNVRSGAVVRQPQKVIDFKLRSSGASVAVFYSDITSQELLSVNSSAQERAAIVSADDTMISAGGGVAFSLLKRAGPKFLLNELGKLAPIPQGTTAVTSGGSLPVQYIIHAAALDIDASGNYSVTTDSVVSVVSEALAKVEPLGIDRIYFPLIGAGVAGLSAAECLDAILYAAESARDLPGTLNIVIAIFDYQILEPYAIRRIARRRRNSMART